MTLGFLRITVIAALGLSLAPGTARAQAAPGAEAPADIAKPAEGLFGTWGGWRDDLRAQGLALKMLYVGEVLGRSGSGAKTGPIGEGRLETTLEVDGQTAFGQDGLLLHATAYTLHGHGLTRCCVNNLAAVSNIEANPGARLFTLWAQQVFDDGRGSIRIGALAGDDEFITSRVAGALINGTFGWPTFTAANLPSGGPAFPLASPGLRLQYAFDPNWTGLVAVLSGDGADAAGRDPQIANGDGLRLGFANGALIMGEVQVQDDPVEASGAQPASFKLGFYAHTGRFADQRYDARGLALANPAGSGTAALLHGTWGVYGVGDLTLWHQGDKDGPDVSLFVRLGATQADRNPVNLYADGGLVWTGLDPDRPNDALALGLAYVGVSPALANYDRDLCRFGAGCGKARTYEVVTEVNYQIALDDSWSVQPVVQYVARPGGAGRDVIVHGLRTALRF